MDSDRPSYVAGTEPTIDPAMTAVRNPNAKAMQSAIGGGVMAPAGAVGGAAGGYQIAQAILGDEAKKPKKRKKKKDSVVNKKEASDLLWCANQLVKQAEPSSPYGQMTPPYLQKAIGAVGSGLKDMGQGLSDTLTNRKTQTLLFSVSLILGIVISVRTLTKTREEEEENRTRILVLEEKVKDLEEA